MFDKEAQRRRAAELSAAQLAAGAKPVSLPPIPVKAAATPLGAWPFATPGHPAYSVNPSVPVAKSVVLPIIKAKKEKKVAVKYLIEPFTNEIGQVIQPGQRIVAVKQGYNHSIKVSGGMYLGLRRDSKGGVKSVVVRIKGEERGYFKADGSRASYSASGASYGTRVVERQQSLPRKRIYAIL